MDGVTLGVDNTHGFTNYNNTYSCINHFFRRASGFLDIVCDTGSGAAHTITHNLRSTPEFIIRKARNNSSQWEVWHSGIAATNINILNAQYIYFAIA